MGLRVVDPHLARNPEQQPIGQFAFPMSVHNSGSGKSVGRVGGYTRKYVGPGLSVSHIRA